MKILKRFNLLDLALLVTILVSALGLFMAKAGYAGVDKVIEGSARVNIDVYLAGFKTKDPELFKIGEKTALTIRNQPVEPPMTIVGVKHCPKQVAFLAADGKKAVAFADPSQPLAHDFVITVADEAERTKDGYVIRGNKIKVGNQVELEGFQYRVQGVVVGISAQP
ncbi:MAG: DUF4330 domain-containing protein [Candidatus Obscuribacterales bacterium]|nr:DUF4330 domain-containing protein [Candidatus Obscuribacterales bacterium]